MRKPFLGVPFGSCVMPLTPSRPSWAVLGSFFGSFGVTLGSLWSLWGALGCLGTPGQPLDEQVGRKDPSYKSNDPT